MLKARAIVAGDKDSSKTKEFDNSLKRYIGSREGQEKEYSIRVLKLLRRFQEEFRDDVPMCIGPIIYGCLREVIVLESARGDDWAIAVMREYGSFKAIREAISYAFNDESSSIDGEDVITKIAEYGNTFRKRATVYCYAGDCCLKALNMIDAISYYDDAIQTDSKYVAAYLHRARAYVMFGCELSSYNREMAEAAQSCYYDAICIRPRYALPHKLLGELYQKMSERDPAYMQKLELDAVDSYLKALEYKAERVKYESLYESVRSLLWKNIDHERARSIVNEAHLYSNKRLSNLLADLSQVQTNCGGRSEKRSIDTWSIDELDEHIFDDSNDIDPEYQVQVYPESEFEYDHRYIFDWTTIELGSVRQPSEAE